MPRFPFLPVLLILTAGALAQVPQPAQPQPGQAALPALPSSVRLQFPNADIKDILDFYETLTRKRLIRPNQVLMGQIYLVINEELPREEAVKIIEMTLMANGFTLVPAEDSTILKVFGNGVNPRTGGVPIISDPALLPLNEQVVTFLFKLKFADPMELAQTMQAFIAPSQAGYTSVIPLPKSQAILVTENTPILRGLLRVVAEIDLPPAEVVSEFITLERADAKDVIEKLEKLFEKQPAPGGAPGTAPRPGRPTTTPEGTPIPAGATAEAIGSNTVEISSSGTLTEDAVIIGKIKLTADIRTNRIHVITRPVNIRFIRNLLKEFDMDVPFGEPDEYPLKFVTASDVLESVVKAIQDPGAKDAATGGTGDTSGAQAGRQNNTRNTGNSFGSNMGGGSAGGGGGGGGFSEELQTQEVSTVPKAVTVGNTRIIADTRANKIIVLGNREVKQKIWKLLAHLDVRAPQVMIHAVIGQLELGKGQEFGLDYILHSGGNLATSTSTTTGGTTGTTTTPLGSFAQKSATLALGSLLTQGAVKQIATAGTGGLSGFITAGDSLSVLVNALEKTNRFHVVARPHIFTSNNKKAIIASGQEIAVPTQTLTSINNSNPALNQDNASVSSSIQFKRVALQLEVVPLINSEREVTLEILQKIDDVLPNQDRTVGGNAIPTIANRFLKSTVSVPNEATLVLGGLIRQEESKDMGGIPYLNRLPLVGPLFRSTRTNVARSELVILMRPVVSMGPDESIMIREREQEIMKIEPDIESTLYPKGVHRGVPPPPKPTFRKPLTPQLREAPASPALRK